MAVKAGRFKLAGFDSWPEKEGDLVMNTRIAIFVGAVRKFIGRSHRSQIELAAFACLLLAVSGGCGGGGSSPIQPPPPKEAAPSNLRYPQSSITATIGQAIASDVPTISGNVTSYTVAPALPTGLNLNASTGAISGTPTVTATTATYTVTAANSVGSATAAVQITVNDGPPANLVYSPITGVVGQEISWNYPTVIGAVTAYTIDPPLPAGLEFENTSGAIYGTPTITTPTAAYVVTATNSFGSTTASVQITVNPAAPVRLIYPRKIVIATQGRMITPDIPTVDSPVTNYTIDPALPAGLNLNTLTGVISGTPQDEAPSKTYVITASNITGSTTTIVSVSVARTMRTLLYLGHEYEIKTMRAQGSQLVSLDSHGFWTLWDFDSGAVIADGDEAGDLDMAGTTIVTAIANGLEIRASDGHVLSTVIVPELLLSSTDPQAPRVWWRLASDGSYVCAGSKAGLFVWNLAGELAATRSGDYSNAKTFSAPGEVRVALGPAGGNVIETISTVDGTSSLSEPFFGTFYAWFADGGRFLSSLSQAVWVYSKEGVQQSIIELPIQSSMGGEGNWFWNVTGTDQFSIYAVGESAPTVTYSFDSPTVIPSGTTIGLVNYTGGAISIIDLSGSIPTKFDPSVPVGVSNYAAASASRWALGNTDGVLVDGASLSGEPRYFALGSATIAGSSNRVVVATASGTIFSFDPAITTPEKTIALRARKVALSGDGTVLAASVATSGLDNTLKVYSLPSASLISNFTFGSPGPGQSLLDFSLSTSGGTLGQVTGGFLGMTWVYQRQVLPVAGGTPSWSDMGQMNNTPIQISPDGTLVAVSKTELWGMSSAPYSPLSTTQIFKNGALVTVVPGYATGWLDNGRLLVNTYVKLPCTEMCSGEFGYASATIYGPDGVVLATPPIPELLQFQTITPDHLYSVTENFIVSLTTGEILWKSPYPRDIVGGRYLNPIVPTGGVGGGFAVFDAERHVFVERY